jgi:hypothetical protein
VFNPDLALILTVTESPSKVGVCLSRSYRGILDETRIRKRNTYKHTTPYMKFKLELLHIKCHVLEFTKDEAKKIISKDKSKFYGSVHLSQ